MDSEKLKETLEKHTLWLRGESGGARANLSGANLSGANLSGANLSKANLSWANLSWANLSWANLSRANLSRANLSKANLSGANLSWANLSKANLSGANLSGAIGNGKEIKSLQASCYLICYTETELAIGCQKLPLETWLAHGDADISKMAHDALEWWAEWKPKLIALGVFDTITNKAKEGS